VLALRHCLAAGVSRLRRLVHTYAVIDFETTGLSAGPDRIIEVGAVLVRDGVVVERFDELMDPGFRIPAVITSLTGITSAMVRGKPRPEAVMPRLREFLGGHVCIAHNASFDRRFFAAEMALAGQAHDRPFLCSMLVARRLLPQAPSHKLGVLARHLGLTMPAGMQAHRALADALITVALWESLLAELRRHLPGRTPEVELLNRLARTPKGGVATFLAAMAASDQVDTRDAH